MVNNVISGAIAKILHFHVSLINLNVSLIILIVLPIILIVALLVLNLSLDNVSYQDNNYYVKFLW